MSNAIAISTLTQSFASASDPLQKAAILGAERFGLANLPASQFFGWLFPSFGYLITAFSMRQRRLGGGLFIVGLLASVTDIAGSIAFLSPGSYWETFLTPGLALLGIFAMLAGIKLIGFPQWRTTTATAAG